VTENSTDNLQPFVHRLADAFRQAQRQIDIKERWLNASGEHFQLRFAGETPLSALWPALAHLETAADDSPDITFHVWDTATTGVNPPRPPFSRHDYSRYGQRALADDGTIAVMFAPTVPMLFAFDRMTRQGFFWTTDATQLSIYERAAPLQTLFYWALSQIGWHIIHAAAAGTEQGGVLLIGNTGAGKSTTALSCLANDTVRFLCDDKCMVSLKPEPQAFAIFSSAKLKADMVPHLPHLQPLIAGWDDTYKAGKSLLNLYPALSGQMITNFPLKALLIPRLGNDIQPRLKSASPSDAFRVLGPSTVIWLPGAEADSYRFMAQLVQQLPCYFFDLSPQIDHNVHLIRDFLQGM
jgi:hypothetical protein